MTKWRFDPSDEDAGFASRESLLRTERGKMPVAADARAKAASKDTWRGQQATRRIARLTTGIRNRRQKRVM